MAERLAAAATISADYQYDANGNRTAKDTQTYIYLPDSNQLTQAGDSKLILDAAGNTTEYGRWRYTYSRAGRLEEVRHGWALKGTYAYDAQGRRTRKQVYDKVTVYHYDLMGNLILETRPDGYPIRAYVYAGETPVAQIDVRGRAHEEEDHDHDKHYQERLAFLHTDALGTPRLATDARQAIVWRWTLDAFGAKPNTDIQDDTRFSEQENDDEGFDGDNRIRVNLRFPGQYFDSETGLYYNWNNYYDPKTGRWITADKMSVAEHIQKWRASLGTPEQLPLELNPYVYVANNPLQYVDPTRLGALGAAGDITVGVGGVLVIGGLEGKSLVVTGVGATLVGVGLGLHYYDLKQEGEEAKNAIDKAQELRNEINQRNNEEAQKIDKLFSPKTTPPNCPKGQSR